jgi:hypothetical protein
VSGCILARNNAYGYSVQFSLRGMGESGPQQFASSVTPHNKLPSTNPPVTVPSLEGCGEPLLGDRDCSWVADKVGICDPGETVVLGAGARTGCGAGPILGTGGAPTEMLRVCPGHIACDAADAIPTSSDCITLETRIKFTCPSEGFTKGMYSVMQAHYKSNRFPYGVVGSTRTTDQRCEALRPDVWQYMPTCLEAWTSDCTEALNKLCHYPAPEHRVFRWLEGSFYGDIFGSKNLNPDKPEVFVKLVAPFKKLKPVAVVHTRYHDGPHVHEVPDGGAGSAQFSGVVFRSMYACSSPNWETGRAYMERRICAGPSNDWSNPYEPGVYTRECAARYVGTCRVATDTPEPSKCTSYEGLGKEHFATCKDDLDREWQWPITSVLADPTDAIPDPAVNAVITGAPIEGW